MRGEGGGGPARGDRHGLGLLAVVEADLSVGAGRGDLRGGNDLAARGDLDRIECERGLRGLTLDVHRHLAGAGEIAAGVGGAEVGDDDALARREEGVLERGDAARDGRGVGLPVDGEGDGAGRAGRGDGGGQCGRLVDPGWVGVDGERGRGIDLLEHGDGLAVRAAAVAARVGGDEGGGDRHLTGGGRHEIRGSYAVGTHGGADSALACDELDLALSAGGRDARRRSDGVALDDLGRVEGQRGVGGFGLDVDRGLAGAGRVAVGVGGGEVGDDDVLSRCEERVLERGGAA